MAKFRCGVRYAPPNLRKLGYEEDIYLFATRDRHKPGLFLRHTREWVRQYLEKEDAKNKQEATARAKDLRNQGWDARVVFGFGAYRIYRRKSQRAKEGG